MKTDQEMDEIYDLVDEVVLLRQVVRKMQHLMPGPRGREVCMTPEQHECYLRAINS